MTATESNPPMTALNYERTGSRNDLALSRSLRNIPSVRHLDVDMYQYDPKTYDVEAVFEATSADVDPYVKTYMIRKIAKKLNAYAVLVVHRYQDELHLYPVRVWIWDEEGTEQVQGAEISWDNFEDLCTQIHEIKQEEKDKK